MTAEERRIARERREEEEARRARIRAEISQLEGELRELNIKIETLESAKAKLPSVEEKINNGMRAAEAVNSALSEEYNGKPYKDNVLPNIEKLLSRKAIISSEIEAYKSDIDKRIKELQEKANSIKSRINWLIGQL